MIAKLLKVLMPLPLPIHASKKPNLFYVPMTKGHLTHTDGLHTGRCSSHCQVLMDGTCGQSQIHRCQNNLKWTAYFSVCAA